jgi:hypothetical protein
VRDVILLAAAVGLAGGVAAGAPHLIPADPGSVRGVGTGALIGAAASLAGALLVRTQLAAPQARFLGAVVGAMLLRLTLFGVAVAVVALTGTPPIAPFLIGLAAAYVGLQAAEVTRLHRASARTVQATTPAAAANRRREEG